MGNIDDRPHRPTPPAPSMSCFARGAHATLAKYQACSLPSKKEDGTDPARLLWTFPDIMLARGGGRTATRPKASPSTPIPTNRPQLAAPLAILGVPACPVNTARQQSDGEASRSADQLPPAASAFNVRRSPNSGVTKYNSRLRVHVPLPNDNERAAARTQRVPPSSLRLLYKLRGTARARQEQY